MNALSMRSLRGVHPVTCCNEKQLTRSQGLQWESRLGTHLSQLAVMLPEQASHSLQLAICSVKHHATDLLQLLYNTFHITAGSQQLHCSQAPNLAYFNKLPPMDSRSCRLSLWLLKGLMTIAELHGQFNAGQVIGCQACTASPDPRTASCAVWSASRRCSLLTSAAGFHLP